MVNTVLDFLRRVVGKPSPESGAVPATPSDHEPITTATVASIRSTLDEHDRGVFLRSALLADLIRRDGDMMGALQQRVLPLQALPTVVTPFDDTPVAVAAAEELQAAWGRVMPAPVAFDLACDGVLLGFGLGQKVWQRVEGASFLEPQHMAWAPASVEYDRTRALWIADSVDQGRVDVCPGDDRWTLYTPRGSRAPWTWGAIRATAEPYLRGALADSDASQHAEVHGSAIWKAKLPAGARQSPDGKAFARSLRTMGRGGVIPVPQGKGDGASYDVELIEAKSDAYRIFEWMRTSAGGRIRLAILGQDLTSQNNKVGTNASSETGLTVTDRIVAADAAAWGECMTSQVARVWAKYRGVPCPTVKLQAKTKPDVATLMQWKSLGANVDADAAAKEAGVPLLEKAPPPPLPTPKTPATKPTNRAHRHDHYRAETNVPALTSARPLWRFKVVEADTGPCAAICAPYAGVTRPGADAWWKTHTPPLHYNCRCFVETLRAGAAITSDDALASLPEPLDGFGDGTVPLSADDEAVLTAVLAAAVVLGVGVALFGRAPKDGGTGQAYNPALDEPGAHREGRWIEVGAGVTGPSGEAWPAWDDASQDDRIAATVAYEHARYDGLSEDEAITRALATEGLSDGARAILESMRDGTRFVVPDDEEDE